MPKTWNITFITFLLLITAGLIYLLAPILTPFLIGAILAYLFNPLVFKLTSFGLPRLLSVILVFIILIMFFVLLILLLIPLVEKQIILLVDVIPNMIAWVQNKIIPWLRESFGIDNIANVTTIKEKLAENWTKAGGVVSWVLKTTLTSSFALIAILTNIILVPVVTFYLLRDWHQLVNGLRDLLPRSIEPTAVRLAKDCDSVLSAFFRGQLLVMLSLGIFYSIGLTAIGLQIGLIIGLVSGLISIVPYLGFIVGIIAASIAALVQFGSFSSVLMVWAVYLLGQGFESMFLTPNLVGDRIGLHPVAVIFAILAGGSLFGFFGVLLALPVAAVVMVLLRFVMKRYSESPLYK